MTVPKMKIVCLKQASVRGTMDLNLRTGFLYGQAGEPQYPSVPASLSGFLPYFRKYRKTMAFDLCCAALT